MSSYIPGHHYVDLDTSVESLDLVCIPDRLAPKMNAGVEGKELFNSLISPKC